MTDTLTSWKGRVAVAAAVVTSTGCTREYPAPENLCGATPLGELRDDEAGRVGITPEQAVALVDQSVLEATFVPRHAAADAGEEPFASSVSVAVTLAGGASEWEYHGGQSFADTQAPVCPVGPSMTVPVTVRLELGVGGAADCDGTLTLTGADPEQTWLDAVAVPMQDTPAWLQEIADRVGCPTCDRPLAVRLGLGAGILSPDTVWSAPDGGLNILGSVDANGVSSEAFFDFTDATVTHP